MLQIIRTGLVTATAVAGLFSLSASASELYVPLSHGGANHAGTVLIYNLDNATHTVAPMPGVPDNANADANLLTEDFTAGLIYEPTRKLIYGHLATGGLWRQGAIFEYNPETEEFRILHHFRSLRSNIAFNPQYAPSIDNDKLIGVTLYGGDHDDGILYSFDLNTESFNVLHHFDQTTEAGGNPISHVLVATNGDYYGGSFLGPKSGFTDTGPLWRFNVATHSMVDYTLGDGLSPRGQVVQNRSKGDIFSVQYANRTHAMQISKISLDGRNFSQKTYDDSTTSVGYRPRTLVQGADGSIYGICEAGASTGTEFGLGSIFTVENGLRPTLRHAFNSAIKQPLSLIDGGNGLLYGTTRQGDTDPGLIFEFDVGTRQLTPLYTGALLPKTPVSGVSIKFVSAPIRIPNTSKLYGISVSGSVDASNQGVLYEYDLDTDIFSVKLDFGYPAGAAPVALTRHSNGNVYGVGQYGGIGGDAPPIPNGGANVAYNTEGASFLLDVSTSTVSPFSLPTFTNYIHPGSQLVEGPDEKLYGMALRGVTRIDSAKDQSFTSIYSLDPVTGDYAFEGDLHGVGRVPTGLTDELKASGPNSNLIEAGNQMYYGCTGSSCFEFDPLSKVSRTLHIFDTDSAPEGSFPFGLVEGDGGILYGVTEVGGPKDAGAIFSMTVEESGATVEVLHEFLKAIDGGRPSTAPVFANGALYGVTFEGGLKGKGTYYRYTLDTKTFEVLHHFGGAEGDVAGGTPAGSVYLASDGKLYGTTTDGGEHDLGALFRCELDAGNCAPVFAFTDTSGFLGKRIRFDNSVAVNFSNITELIRKPPCGLSQGGNNVMLRDTAAEWLLKCNSRDPNFPEPPTLGTIYTDVAQHNYNAGFIERLHNTHLTEGCNDDNNNRQYCRKMPVDKVQAVKLILRAAHRETSHYKPPSTDTAPFADVPMSDPDVDWIAQAKKENITNGCGDGSNFCPGEQLTEAGFLTMLSGAF